MWFIRKCSNLTEGYLKNQKCPPYFVNLNMVNFQTLILNRSDINTRLTIFSFFIQTVKNGLNIRSHKEHKSSPMIALIFRISANRIVPKHESFFVILTFKNLLENREKKIFMRLDSRLQHYLVLKMKIFT